MASFDIGSAASQISVNNTSSGFVPSHNAKKTIQRFTDVTAGKYESLPPITGYEKQPLVSLEDAVAQLRSMLPGIDRKACAAKLKCKNPADGLTPDQSASIMLYTMEWEPYDQCLYAVLNKTLRKKDRNALKPWFPYLKLILTALSRLPAIEGTVYRGVQLNLSAQHPNGTKFCWWSFSSCTTSMEAVQHENFLGKTGTRTLFTIKCMNGRQIRRHSYFKKEEEVLLLPGTQFEVSSCATNEPDFYAIQLKETKPEFPFLQPVN